jgi:hypothetical protein
MTSECVNASMCPPGTPHPHAVEAEVAGEVVEDQVVEVVPPAAEPAPVLAGTFAIYQLDDGGFLLVTETPDRGVDRKLIPGKLIRLFSKGPGAKLFGQLFGG